VNLDKDCKDSEIVFAILETYDVLNFKASSSNQIREIGLIARRTLSLGPKGKVKG
jgi:hypothetical protein